MLKNLTKRALSLMLALVFALSLFGISAFALPEEQFNAQVNIVKGKITGGLDIMKAAIDLQPTSATAVTNLQIKDSTSTNYSTSNDVTIKKSASAKYDTKITFNVSNVESVCNQIKSFASTGFNATQVAFAGLDMDGANRYISFSSYIDLYRSPVTATFYVTLALAEPNESIDLKIGNLQVTGQYSSFDYDVEERTKDKIVIKFTSKPGVTGASFVVPTPVIELTESVATMLVGTAKLQASMTGIITVQGMRCDNITLDGVDVEVAAEAISQVNADPYYNNAFSSVNSPNLSLGDENGDSEKDYFYTCNIYAPVDKCEVSLRAGGGGDGGGGNYTPPTPITPVTPVTPVTPEEKTQTVNAYIKDTDGNAFSLWKSYDAGSDWKLPVAPTTETTKFVGWFSDDACTTSANLETLIANGGNIYGYYDLADGVTEEDSKKSTLFYQDGAWRNTEVPEILESDHHIRYITGYEDPTVRPNNNITREEIATILYRLITEDVQDEYPGVETSFSDVASDRWSAVCIDYICKLQLVEGYDDGTFGASKPITRAELATILSRIPYEGSKLSNVGFTDVGGHWAEDAIKEVASRGWITGYDDGSFQADALITRAETVTMINRVLFRYIDDESALPDETKEWVDNVKGAWYYYDMKEASSDDHDFSEERRKGYLENWFED